EPTQGRDGGGDVAGVESEGPGETGEIVHVEVGDGGGHNRAVLVVDRVMEKRQVERRHRITLRASRASGGRCDRRRRAAPGRADRAAGPASRAATPLAASG